MKLPGSEHAIIEPVKLHDYLLSNRHPIGRFKAAYFESLGFVAESWPRLEQALRLLATEGDATLGETTSYGQKYEVRGRLKGPSAEEGFVVTVWIILRGENIPRFVTAFPGDRP